MSRTLTVLLHGAPVGYLQEGSEERVEFRFEDAYWQSAPRPVLGQKFEDDPEKRTYGARRKQTLPDFFTNLIPEGGRLRQVIEKAAGLVPGDDLALLEHVGRDLPGAVEVVESAPGAALKRAVERDDEPLEAPEEDEQLRFSLAGVQLKFSVLLEGEKLTLPAAGKNGDWIVKFDSPTFSRLPENELSMLEWARACGFEVPECQLREPAALASNLGRYHHHGRVLAIRRYDRAAEGRTHQEDFAQVVGLPPEKKYDQVTYEGLGVLARRIVGEDGFEEYLRRLAFVIASGNNDAHLKNWSLIYPDRVQARWSPLYDQVATVSWREAGRELSLKLAGVKEFHRLDAEAFRRFGERTGSSPEKVLGTVRALLDRARTAWKSISGELPLPAEHRAALEEHWTSVPLLRDIGPLA